MIGVYDYTVIATYLSLFLGLSGIFTAMDGSIFPAMFCLMLAGTLDAFDGRIARTKKNRTDTEKRFGIQIDSLNDLVCFGVLPAVMGAALPKSVELELGSWKYPYLAVMIFFALGALIRLAYFNVSEEERQSKTSEKRKFYLGVPVTTAACAVPLFWLIPLQFGWNIPLFYCLALLLLGILFIIPVKITKPDLKGILCMGVVCLGELVWMLSLLF